MPRQSTYINKITTKDASMLRAISRTGYLDRQMLKDEFGMSDKRILNFTRDKILVTERCYKENENRSVEAYRLSPHGRIFVQRELNMCSLYCSTSASHDLALAKVYVGLSEGERETWQTESMLRDIYNGMIEYEKNYEQVHDISVSPIDASYVSVDGVTVGVEIITDNYGKAEMEAKEAFSSSLGLNTTYIKA